jgi:hypothetical protein
VEDKALGLMRPHLGEAKSRSLITLVRNLEHITVREICREMAPQ